MHFPALAIADQLVSMWNLALVIFGFGLIIFIHELGHFLAARWAKIRVLAFSIGFGPVLASYRKGLGLRRGSSEPGYFDLQQAADKGDARAQDRLASLSPTEYRLSWLPLGGYVKMLGQDDLDPSAVSGAPDSYQNATIPKRMVVISAGVIFNIIMAAVLFVIVFMAGLTVEPARIGLVAPDAPAAKAVPLTEGVDQIGLQPGDTILSIDGRTPDNFSDLRVAAAMAPRDKPVRLSVRRDGYAEPISFEIIPDASAQTGLLDLGVAPPVSLRVENGTTQSERAALSQWLERDGLAGVEPGMTLMSAAGDDSIDEFADLYGVFGASRGEPVELIFGGGEADANATVTVHPRAELQQGRGSPDGLPFEHLLGMGGVLRVSPLADAAAVKQGLIPGDVFARIGGVEFPSFAEGIAQIRAHAGRRLEVAVIRHRPAGDERVTLAVQVTKKGQIGFTADTTVQDEALLSLPVGRVWAVGEDGDGHEPPAASVVTLPGVRVLEVDGGAVNSIPDIRARLIDATRAAHESGAQTVDVQLEIELPLPDHPVEEVTWTLARADLDRLHALGWEVPFSAAAFEPVRLVDRTSNPLVAIGRGVKHTHRVMLQTYMTFARLFGGTVKLEHLKGPVGIADLGTKVARHGLVSLLFFMALISVNLAVINFLPLPIVDGGQFLMLIYEWARGRPVPIGVQSGVSMAGLLLIGGLFLLVTFNDIRSLLGM